MAAMNTIALDTELVTLTTNGAVATLTLNRPDARNALSLEMIAAMEEALGKIESGLDEIRVMVLAGAGKGFCAGMDLKAVQDDPILMGDMLRRLAAISRRSTGDESLGSARSSPSFSSPTNSKVW